jgi:hypothetical protein
LTTQAFAVLDHPRDIIRHDFVYSVTEYYAPELESTCGKLKIVAKLTQLLGLALSGDKIV